MDGAVGMRAPPHVGYIAGGQFGIKGFFVVAMSRARVLLGDSEHGVRSGHLTRSYGPDNRYRRRVFPAHGQDNQHRRRASPAHPRSRRYAGTSPFVAFQLHQPWGIDNMDNEVRRLRLHGQNQLSHRRGAGANSFILRGFPST